MDFDHAAGKGTLGEEMGCCVPYGGRGGSVNEKGTKKIPLEEILYFGFFLLLSIAKGFGLYDGQKLFLLLVMPALLCGLLKILITPYTRIQWGMTGALLVMAAIIYYQSREKGIFFVLFLILGMKNISLKKIMRTGLWVWSLCAAALSIFSFFRLEHTIYRVDQKMGLGHIFRWSLGFTHPNILHITYFALCAFIIYELAERYGLKHFVLLMLGNVFVFFYSVSFTGFGITTIFLVGELYVRFRPKFCLWEKAAVCLVLPVCILFSFLLPWLYAAQEAAQQLAPWLEKLNSALNTRIWLASQYMSPEYRSLFGAEVALQRLPYGSIDSSYMWCYINYGLVPFLLFMAAYMILIADACRKQKTREAVMIVCFLAAGFTEQLLFNTSFKNITLLFLGELLYRQKEGEKEYGLLPSALREIVVPVPGVWVFCRGLPKQAANLWKSCRKQILAGILGGAFAGILLCGILYTPPKGYVVPRVHTDGLFDLIEYLESAEDPAYEGYRIMNYTDADTRMQVIEENAVVVETARYYAGSVLIGGLAGYLLCIVICLRRKGAGQGVAE
ncbi:MAG: hypothetical protein K2H40_04965 [Lachnospiraceae bacterium]|nr:hypothetical protein [Lachnospiraceae bacterium]